jgi:hypothetical protein
VREVARALDGLSADELLESYDPAAMRAARLYCAPDERHEDDRAKDLRHYHEELVAFYREAARQGQGVIAWLP